MTSTGSISKSSSENSELTSRDGDGPNETDSPDEVEFAKAWMAHEVSDAALAKAQLVSNMPPATSVAELLERELMIANLEAQADAARPPPAITGKPIPEPLRGRALASLEERSRIVGVDLGAESPTQRRARRAARLAELGGGMRSAGDGWQTVGERGALAKLVREERAASQPMSDKTDVRKDLIAALGGQSEG